MAKRDAGFSLLLAFAAFLTLGIKVWASDYSLVIDSAEMTRALQAKLAQQGFTTRYENHPYQSDVIEASRGPCRLRVRDGALASQFATTFTQQSQLLGPIHYIYQGTWLDQPPLFRMNVERAGAHVLARLGLSGRFPAALAVAARGCDPAAIDFSGLVARWAPPKAPVGKQKPAP